MAEISKINLGHATAYGYYKAGGGTATEEEFIQLCADLGIQVEYLENMTVIVNTLEPGEPATATYENGVLTFGIPKGEQGDPAPADEITEATDAWLAENISNPSNPPLDRSLTLANAAAPADMVGDLRSAFDKVAEKKESIDFTTASTKSGLIGSDNKWATSASSSSYTFDVSELKVIEVTASDDYQAKVSLLASKTLTAGSRPTFATGIDGGIVVPAGESATIAVPSDCIYVVVTKVVGSSGQDRTPASMNFVYYKVVPEVDDTLTIAGDAADAKATGDAIEDVRNYASDVPDEYTRLEYLESTSGGEQYCSFTQKLNQDSRIVVTFAPTLDALQSSSFNYICGARKNSSENAKTIAISSSHRLNIGYGSTSRSIDFFFTDLTPHTVDYDKNKVYFDGELVAEFTPATFETPNYAYMFAITGASSSKYYGAVRIYRAKLYDENGILIADYVPVIDKATNLGGMYDLVTNTFKRNPSSTALVNGPITTVTANAENILKLKTDVSNLQTDISNLQEEISVKEYIQTEADRVSHKIHSVQTGETLTFIACSDLHYAVAVGSSDEVTVKDSQEALRDMTDAIVAIAGKTHIDFYACFGDVIYQWQNHGANYDNGVTEMFSVTKLLSEAFKNNPQVRMVGNHDPNCENNNDKEFSAYMMNSFTGIFSEMLKKSEEYPYGGFGYHDFDRQKVRMIVLNTSFYKTTDDLTNGATYYNIGVDQAYWLCTALDMSDKSDADEWQIVICSHVAMDAAHATICRYTAVLNAYLDGGTWSYSSKSYDFSGKNAAKLVLYLNGHSHLYGFKNLNYTNASAEVQKILPIAKLYVPNALPGREGASTDGETYSKTADTAESTSFQVITVDFVNKVVYAHHYGAGIDIVMHYEPSTESSLSTGLTGPVWASVDDAIATVSDGEVTPVAEGYVMIWAKSETDNCIECWNYQSAV